MKDTMTGEEVLRVVERFAPQGTKQLHAESDLIKDLGFDSVRLMELMFALEERFKITFADEHLDIRHFQTPSAIARLIEGIQ